MHALDREVVGDLFDGCADIRTGLVEVDRQGGAIAGCHRLQLAAQRRAADARVGLMDHHHGRPRRHQSASPTPPAVL